MDTSIFSLAPEQFDLDDWLTFEIPIPLDHDFSDISSTASLTRASTRDSQAIEPSRVMPSYETVAFERSPLKLTWLEEGQTHPKTRSQRRLAPQFERPAPSVTSSDSSSPSLSPNDSHSEASCSKCRMTEMEARRCRVERRREQNRASQRKFRARKEAKIRDAVHQVSTLEVYVEFLEKQNDDLEAANARIFQQLEDLRKSYTATANNNASLLAIKHARAEDPTLA